MSATRETTIWCDVGGCKSFVQHQGTIEQAREEVLAQHWRRINGKDVCRMHNEYTSQHIRKYFKKVEKEQA